MEVTQECIELTMKKWSDDIVSAHSWLSGIVAQLYRYTEGLGTEIILCSAGGDQRSSNNSGVAIGETVIITKTVKRKKL